jgi:hypothetical protein
MLRTILLAALSVCILLPASPIPALEGDTVYYIGGSLPGLAEGQDGHFDMTSREVLRFMGAKSKWELPYSSITQIEYGRKPGRQVAAAVIVSPFFLAAPKRKHFLTLQMKDTSGNLQAGVFELSKARYVEIIADLEERTHLKVAVETAVDPANKKK